MIQYDKQGFPTFFADAPTLKVRDELAEFLGAAQNGIMEYSYLDAVRLCGHSCPTVAGAYLMVLHGLRALYGDDLPERGQIEVLMRGARNEGTTGVTASVATLLTGAAVETGFAGIGAQGQFSRRDLMAFEQESLGVLSLCRRDNGKRVAVSLNATIVPFADEMKTLMPKAVSGMASPEEKERFAQLWQERVRKMLIEHADDKALIIVEIE